MSKKDKIQPGFQKKYYHEVLNHELYETLRIALVFCLDYLRKHVTEDDMRNLSVYSFSSDKTEDIKAFRNNFNKILKNDYSFEVSLQLFAANLLGKFRSSISETSDFKELTESLLGNEFLENTYLNH
jgi:hypothetical protein